MIICRRLHNGPSPTVVAAAFIFILFVTKQAKDLYERNQKQYRMENYSQFISEVSSSMGALEVAANKSGRALRHLTDVLQRRHREQRPASPLS